MRAYDVKLDALLSSLCSHLVADALPLSSQTGAVHETVMKRVAKTSECRLFFFSSVQITKNIKRIEADDSR